MEVGVALCWIPLIGVVVNSQTRCSNGMGGDTLADSHDRCNRWDLGASPRIRHHPEDSNGYGAGAYARWGPFGRSLDFGGRAGVDHSGNDH